MTAIRGGKGRNSPGNPFFSRDANAKGLRRGDEGLWVVSGFLSVRYEVHPAGFEPATFGFVNRCSIQLS